MARSVRVGDFQAMQRGATNGATVATASDDGPGPDPTLTVAEQLAELTIHPAITADLPLGEVAVRLRTRADLLGIRANGGEVLAEARRRCGMLAEPTAEDAIAAAEGLPLYADAPDEVIASLGQDDPAGDGPAEPPVPDAMTRLVTKGLNELDVGSQCTAEMSLHMITERVREAVLETDWGKLATDAEIVAEAERIWVSLDRQRSHTYSVESDGSVRDWRRPDTTPDRGDVTTVHTITDETEEQRFSGAGDGQQANMFPVPTGSDFSGKLYRDAPELANIAERLIESKDYLEHLSHCEIRYAWRRKSSSSKRRRQTGGLKRGSDWFGQLLGADFGIWLAADTARERRWSPRHVERYLLHQLLRIGQDDHGNFVEQAPTLQVFAPEITEYADVADEDDKIGRSAFQAAEQIGLWVDEDEDAEDDGSGVLIHADGTPLTDDEIEAMERHELNDEEDDDGDPLADHDL